MPPYISTSPPTPPASRKPPRWLARLLGQFRRPHGIPGRVAGWIMATRPSNVQRNRWTVDLLDLQPEESVLEIGYGPGVAIDACAKQALRGHVLGIDHSELMHLMASRRNRAGIAAGRIELRLGTLADLKPDDGPFDKALTVNCAQFWDDPEGTLRDLRTRLRVGGVLALTYQPRHPGATEADADTFAVRATELAKKAGFTKSRVEKLSLKPIAAVCVLVTR